MNTWARRYAGMSWLLAALLASPAHAEQAAQDGLDVSGSARIRYEAVGNQFRPGLERNTDAVLLQATLAAEYRAGPVRIGAELDDSRVYFAGPGSSISTSEVNTLEPVQAYLALDLGRALGKGSQASLKAGRFTLDLGSRRLVARNNFRNTTNAFTGIEGDWRGADGSRFTAFYTLPVQRLPADKPAILNNTVEWDRQNFDLDFWGGFYARPVAHGTTFEAYLYGLDERDAPGTATRDRTLYTPGARLVRKPAAGQWDYEFEGAYQFGHASTTTAATAPRVEVSAYTLHAEVGRTFAGGWKPHLSLEYDRASGDGPGTGYGRFDALYGARRGDFGPTSLFGPYGRSNISAPGVRLEVTPSNRLDAFVHYSPAWLADKTDSFASTAVRDPSGASGSFAGHEIEARARYALVPKLLRIEAGAAVLLEGRFLRDAPNANGFGDPVYGYMELSAQF